MLDDLRNWIRNRNSNSIRKFVVYFTSAIFILRIVSSKFRESIDIVSIVLFSVIVLAILRKDIKNLISKMKGVGFPGLQIPIEDLEEKLTMAEKTHAPSIRKYKNNIEFLEAQKTKTDTSPYSSLANTSIEIEKELDEIAAEFTNLSKNQDTPPVNLNNLTDYLISRDVIGKDVYQLVKIFLKIKNQDTKAHEEKQLHQIGIRLLRLLEVSKEILNDLKIASSSSGKPFTGKPSTIRLGGMRIEETREKLIAIYTTVNLIDSLETAFPVIALDKNSFKIFEKHEEGVRREAVISKVEPLENNVPLTIIFAIDVSGSMKNNNKLKLVKKAALNLINKITKYSTQTNLRIAILPFNERNKNRLVTFKSKKKWSNNFEEIKQEIIKLSARGGTPLYDAISFSIDSLKDVSGYKYIICLSDGAATEEDNEYTKSQILSEAKKHKIPIYTVGYGKDKHLHFLVKLSKITNAGELGVGSFMRVSPNKIDEIFGYLSGSLAHSYGIYWKPSNYRKGVTVEFDIEVVYRTNSYGEIKVQHPNNTYKLK